MPGKKKASSEPSGVQPNSAAPLSLITQQNNFPIVGVGASAGGLEALEQFLRDMPPDAGLAFVIITHQHPGHTSLLPELLRRITPMTVVAAADGMQLMPNHVYIGPSDGRLGILNGTLHHMEAGPQSPKLPIDYFFRSLAEDQHERAICIVLSGTGTDGTLGLRSIKAEGGMSMVEEPHAAKYAGMPASAIATGLADYVLPPAKMPKQLISYTKGPFLTAAAVAAESPPVPVEPMQKIFLLLRSRTGHDFSAYKSSTIRRRIERRMNVHQMKDPQSYVRYLQENPHEVDKLFKELLISVTNFFRDPEAWESLSEPIQQLIAKKPDNYTLRAWIPGCATGEEAYSLAIVLKEAIECSHQHPDLQVFGTDLDAQAIEFARLGQYPDGVAADLPHERLEKYFTHNDGNFRIRKEVRETVIFAAQNLIRDPPFTNLDILSCRNLLIYLNADLQKKLMPIFHYALKPDGLLLLGPSETIGSFTDLFEPVDKRWKIFRRRNTAVGRRHLPEIPAQPVPNHGNSRPIAIKATPREGQISTVLERLLLAKFTPVSVVVNERGDIIYIHGRTGEYLEPSPGQPRNNVIEMARAGLEIELNSALRHCIAQDTDVVRKNVRVKTNGHFSIIDLHVARIKEPASVHGLLLITFRPSAPSISDKAETVDTSTNAPGHIERLERELQHMRESYQTTLEERDTSVEEMKSTNEELQSTNEELQSTNEELETSKEEMQSLNEELTTVNTELHSKVDDLSQANSDMQNLLNSTDIATIFLDNDLNIKRYTEQAKELIMLRQTDIGRPISELASNLKYDQLVEDCREVLKTLVFRQQEVQTTNHESYLMRIIPYRTTENLIDGLVATFVNIQALKKAEKEGELRSFFESIVETVHQPLLVLDEEKCVVTANRSFHEIFRLPQQQVIGTNFFEIGNGEWDLPKLRNLLDTVLTDDQPFEDFAIEHTFKNAGHKQLRLNARKLKRDTGQPSMILLAMEQVSEDASR